MVHRFPTFEIDEPRREVRSGREVVSLQPRVFDLLVYLVKNRDRVVPKDELLDVVWSDVVVADGSLQRAVSLLRATLEKFGAGDAVRTHPRRGYRFCADAPEAAPGAAWDPAVAARRTLADIDRMSPQDLQAWAQNAQCHGKNEAAVAPLEEAVGAFSAAGENRRAGWIATLLAQVRMEWRDLALCRGWHQRARRLLEGEPPGREHGYLGYLGSRLALFQNDMETAALLGEETRAIGEKLRDPDLLNLGLLCLGEAKVFRGEILDGLAALDEAGVAVTADRLSPWAGAVVYCGVIYTCMTRSDWPRAGEWTEQFTRWGEDKGLTSYPGLCRLHRAEVLTVRGRLREAEEELRLAHEILTPNSPWLEGEVWRVEGETMLAQEDFAAARAAFARAMAAGWEVQLELALVQLGEGHADAAANTLTQALTENTYSCRSRRGRALCALIVAASRAGRLAEARKTLAEIERAPELTSTPGLQVHSTAARAELAAAESRHGEAIRLLREAVRAALAMEALLAAGQLRCRLATLLSGEGDWEFARLEWQAAETLLAEASPCLKRIRAELRKLGK
jgi:DNA-binding winged helix-turn-helix (wHTH) protein